VPPLRHEGKVWSAAFNGDESRILTGSDDGTARLWDISRLPDGHLIEIACKMLPDRNTAELEERYGIAIVAPSAARMYPPVGTELRD
jgi:WD40 repeat protein